MLEVLEAVHLVEDGLGEVHGLLEVLVVQGLLEVVDVVHLLEVVLDLLQEVLVFLGVLHSVLVLTIVGVKVKVVHLVVTCGLPATVVRCTEQCLEVVVGRGQCPPEWQSTEG